MPNKIAISIYGTPDPSILAMLRELAREGVQVAVNDRPLAATDEMAECEVCHQVFHKTTVHPHKELLVPACRLCRRAADAIEKNFREAAKRHFGDMRGQLRQMVLDVRSGLPAPVFYRGFDA